MTDPALIRNFSIIAHIDHGKSTLADRLLERTGALSKRELKEQFLDSMDLERERGITIKARSVRLNYTARDGKTYVLNLIDTPGHVDFAYEVSRSLAACEGALLVVDASQGVEAQTLANVYMALDHGLEIVPVINKIDLPGADVDRTRAEIEEIIGLDATGAILTSAKEGVGIEEVLEAVVERIPPPRVAPGAPTRGLIFDSWYDVYQGAIGLVRVFDGELRRGMQVHLIGTGKTGEVMRLAHFTPFEAEVEQLGPGEVGMVAANVKTVADMRVGDTITTAEHPATEPLAGFKELKPMVFAGLYPTESNLYGALRDAIRQVAAQRREFDFRARHLAGARLRLSRGLPRLVAHGDRAGTAGARVRAQPGHHGADRRLPRAQAGRRSADGGQSLAAADESAIEAIEEPFIRVDRAAGIPGRGDESLRGAARRAARSPFCRAGPRALHY